MLKLSGIFLGQMLYNLEQLGNPNNLERFEQWIKIGKEKWMVKL